MLYPGVIIRVCVSILVSHKFPPLLQKGTDFGTCCLLPWMTKIFFNIIESSHKETNLLLGEEVLYLTLLHSELHKLGGVE